MATLRLFLICILLNRRRVCFRIRIVTSRHAGQILLQKALVFVLMMISYNIQNIITLPDASAMVLVIVTVYATGIMILLTACVTCLMILLAAQVRSNKVVNGKQARVLLETIQKKQQRVVYNRTFPISIKGRDTNEGQLDQTIMKMNQSIPSSSDAHGSTTTLFDSVIYTHIDNQKKSTKFCMENVPVQCTGGTATYPRPNGCNCELTQTEAECACREEGGPGSCVPPDFREECECWTIGDTRARCQSRTIASCEVATAQQLLKLTEEDCNCTDVGDPRTSSCPKSIPCDKATKLQLSSASIYICGCVAVGDPREGCVGSTVKCEDATDDELTGTSTDFCDCLDDEDPRDDECSPEAIYCKENPTDPSCKIDCAANPSDPSCQIDCTAHPSDPSCQIDCTANPTDPSCQIDCTANPTDPQCIENPCIDGDLREECKKESDGLDQSRSKGLSTGAIVGIVVASEVVVATVVVATVLVAYTVYAKNKSGTEQITPLMDSQADEPAERIVGSSSKESETEIQLEQELNSFILRDGHIKQ
ncbi:MAG: hypothetical protein EZS28_013021 [Streblomastix strix]|uniref:Uncharacterized protein n=1 Tax=Streblomastix strix TaxID=222440 RepID=A0A5J4W940_9EUKA|nr:MAG: hypothetical protein EZS28_013021 [Streblomastix strix]